MATSATLPELAGALTGVPGVAIDRLDDQTMVVNMGPQHPSTHGVLRIVLELDGEVIVRATPHIGYVHTGIEKTIEYNTYLKGVTLTDRMDYVSAHINNAAFTLSIEKLLDITPPARGQCIRVLLMEVQRLASHLVWLATHALDIGAMTIYFYALTLREKCLDITEHISGVRMMPSWIVPLSTIAADAMELPAASLEGRSVHKVQRSVFGSKPTPTIKIKIPVSVLGCVVSADVSRLRDHPDLRIARRAATLARLAQVISERKVQKGLRRTLLAQANRLLV